MAIIPSVVLHGSEKNDLGEGNHLAKDEPDVNHLDVGGGGQALHLANEDGGHDQHGGQVHAQGCLKEERLEEGGGKGDCSQKKGGEVGGHHLTCDLSLHDNNHAKAIFAIFKGFGAQVPISNLEDRHVLSLGHNQLVWDQSHSGHVQTSHCHINETFL